MERLSLMSTCSGERNEAIDNCLADIDRLSHDVKDASSYLPAYDQRTYSEVLSSTHSQYFRLTGSGDQDTFGKTSVYSQFVQPTEEVLVQGAQECTCNDRKRCDRSYSVTTIPDASYVPSYASRTATTRCKEQTTRSNSGYYSRRRCGWHRIRHRHTTALILKVDKGHNIETRRNTRHTAYSSVPCNKFGHSIESATLSCRPLATDRTWSSVRCAVCQEHQRLPDFVRPGCRRLTYYRG
jgi:hypothetical protein